MSERAIREVSWRRWHLSQSLNDKWKQRQKEHWQQREEGGHVPLPPDGNVSASASSLPTEQRAPEDARDPELSLRDLTSKEETPLSSLGLQRKPWSGHRGPQLQRREARGRGCVAGDSLIREKLSPGSLLRWLTVSHAGTMTPPPLDCRSLGSKDVIRFVPVSFALPRCLV